MSFGTNCLALKKNPVNHMEKALIFKKKDEIELSLKTFTEKGGKFIYSEDQKAQITILINIGDNWDNDDILCFNQNIMIGSKLDVKALMST